MSAGRGGAWLLLVALLACKRGESEGAPTAAAPPAPAPAPAPAPVVTPSAAPSATAAPKPKAQAKPGTCAECPKGKQFTAKCTPEEGCPTNYSCWAEVDPDEGVQKGTPCRCTAKCR